MIKNKAFQEGMSAAVALDYILLVDGVDMINSTEVEALCRKMYGLEQAFHQVFQEEDRRSPKGAKNWTTKVNWSLRDRYSVKVALQGGVQVQAADKEVRDRMESEALFQKYLNKTGAKAEEAVL